MAKNNWIWFMTDAGEWRWWEVSPGVFASTALDPQTFIEFEHIVHAHIAADVHPIVHIGPERDAPRIVYPRAAGDYGQLKPSMFHSIRRIRGYVDSVALFNVHWIPTPQMPPVGLR